MLPSTGYFKGISCPFYDSGLCERPYCHFRHVKKESFTNTQSDGIESGAILQKLVSAAVQKVLRQKETSGLTSTIEPAPAQKGKEGKINITQSKATYNPTPIAELIKISSTDPENSEDAAENRKRHIPVPYTPRKPASLPVKRPLESNGSSPPYVFVPPPVKYTPGCTESVLLDPYTPKGTIESCQKYLPGTEKELQEYTPKESQTSSKHSYVPSDSSNSKKKVMLEYKPVKLSSKGEKSTVTYQPTPKDLVPCFSSDEDEPDLKKPKLSNDLNGFDDLGPEFDILDQILDEEKLATSSNNDTSKEENKDKLISTKHYENEETDKCKYSKKNKDTDSKKIERKENKELCKKKEPSKKHKDCSSSSKKHKTSHTHDDKKTVDRKNDKRPSNKTKSEKDCKSLKHSKGNNNKSTEADNKIQKSSSRNRNKEERKDDKYSNSKKSDHSSKHSKHSSSKSGEKHSRHSSSSSSKHDSEKKDSHGHHKSSKTSFEDKHKMREDKHSKNNLQENDIHIGDTFNDADNGEVLDVSESDEETIALECKKIFEEYVPIDRSKVDIEKLSECHTVLENETEEYVPSKKRISRTTDKNIKVLARAPLKPDFKVSAAQTMAERLTKIKKFHSSRSSHTVSSNESVVSNLEPSRICQTVPHTPSTKIRIAHVPYASTLVNAKKVMPPNTKFKTEEPSTSSTVIQTVKKGTQRVAHQPNEKFIDRPGVLEPLASKIPANIRSTYLNMMIDECLKIYLSSTDAYARAQHEELMTSKKCTAVQIYKNSAVLTISRLRKEFQECHGVKKSGSDCTALQKIPQTISGKTGNVGSWSIQSKQPVNMTGEFSGAKFYKNIYKWILTEEQLQENGFPRPHPSGEKGRAVIYGQNKKPPPKGLIRTCCRCKKDYIVDKKGFPAIQEECIYHPNNKYRIRGEVKYQCCSQDSSSDGCSIASSHVYEYIDFENLKGFIKTMPPDYEMDDYGVYSLDCEMCYTTQGLDLTRVTVIDSSCKVVYETLIKPLHPIIDYNTRYSGITEDQMANVKTTLLEVQATLLSMFSSKTILVGHSLESDFKALKLIHDTVIDTSVLFPHKMGPPYKRALRNLSSEHLKKIIQNSVDGHDSAEDATVCMELLFYKLKEDLKTR